MEPVTARAAAAIVAPLFAGRRGEMVVVTYLDDELCVLAVNEVAGGPDLAPLPVGAIAAEALRIGATGLVLAHNHPSGNPQPSAQDIAATRRLAEALGPLRIRIHDHLIFAGADCVSLRGLGLL
jgi:DNA repair protein RadC